MANYLQFKLDGVSRLIKVDDFQGQSEALRRGMWLVEDTEGKPVVLSDTEIKKAFGKDEEVDAVAAAQARASRRSNENKRKAGATE